MKRSGPSVAVCFAALILLMISAQTFAAETPNILVIWGDDVGQSNVSAYTLRPLAFSTL